MSYRNIKLDLKNLDIKSDITRNVLLEDCYQIIFISLKRLFGSLIDNI